MNKNYTTNNDIKKLIDVTFTKLSYSQYNKLTKEMKELIKYINDCIDVSEVVFNNAEYAGINDIVMSINKNESYKDFYTLQDFIDVDDYE